MKRVKEKIADREPGRDDIRWTGAAVITEEAAIRPLVSENSAKTSRPGIVLMALLMCTLLNWLLAPSGLFADVMEKGGSTSVNSSSSEQLLRSEPNSSDTKKEPQYVPSYPPLSHPNCQIIYVVGVEGSMHHGATDVIKRFAQRQTDSEGKGYVVHSRSRFFRGIVQWYNRKGTMKVSEDVRRNVTYQLCPPNDGLRHVIIEDNSFPSGSVEEMPWKGKTASEIASSLKENPHPVDLKAFARTFAPFADVRFIVLHRPYINTITSHNNWHGGTEGHATVLLGFLKYLAELFGGRRTVGLLCVEQFRGSRNKKDGNATTTPRGRVLADLSQFLHWHHADCPDCFNRWHDSKKDPEEVVGKDAYKMLLDKREKLRGIWPPVLAGDGIPEQQNCPL